MSLSHSPHVNVDVFLFDDDEALGDTEILPNTNRTPAFTFLHQKQSKPEFVLVWEFFPENWSAASYQKLVDSGASQDWFICKAIPSNKHRLGAWKDSNLQYKHLQSKLA